MHAEIGRKRRIPDRQQMGGQAGDLHWRASRLVFRSGKWPVERRETVDQLKALLERQGAPPIAGNPCHAVVLQAHAAAAKQHRVDVPVHGQRAGPRLLPTPGVHSHAPSGDGSTCKTSVSVEAAAIQPDDQRRPAGVSRVNSTISGAAVSPAGMLTTRRGTASVTPSGSGCFGSGWMPPMLRTTRTPVTDAAPFWPNRRD